MPWKGATVVERRFEFVLRARSGAEPISHLCREFGISRKTGHKWLQRYEAGGSVTALLDQSRRPHQSPTRHHKSTRSGVVELRKLYGWSGRKLRKLLKADGIELSRSTIDRIIDRNGLIEKRDRHRPAVKRFERSQPNELWQMDFKGEYILRGVERCYPRSLLDDHSRFSVGLFPLRTTSGSQVRRCVVECFEEFGVPQAMLMDHGTPWWQSNNGHGLTHFSVNLIKQGIRLIYGSVGHPQTQEGSSGFTRR